MLTNNIKRVFARRSIQGNLNRCFSSAPSASASASTSSTTDGDADATITSSSPSPPSPTTNDAKNEGKSEPSKPAPSAPRSIPTRHSRHHRPSVASEDILEQRLQEILASTPGNLITYKSKNLELSKMEEYEEAVSDSYSLQQKVEYLLRGYSSMLPGSITNEISGKAPSGEINADEIIKKMVKLLKRIEQEGNAYVELRSKLRSQLARVSESNQSDSESNDSSSSDSEEDNDETNTDEDANDAWRMNALVRNFGAPPGPSATMYDLILDAIAVSITSSNNPLELLHISHELYSKSLERFDLDSKAGVESLNPSSCPTTMTFNAVIRAATYSTDNEEVRDRSMENAFLAFNAMYHHPVVNRNSSTYRYMLDMMNVHFPAGEIRGNIAAGMWEKAVQDKVVDTGLYESMKKLGSVEHGQLFDNWWKSMEDKHNPDVNGYGFPVVWGKNKKLRRFDKRFDIY